MTIHQAPAKGAFFDDKEMKSVTAGELFDKNFPPREYILSPWFRTGETALVWAATGVGKTMLTLSLAIAIAGGGRVWQWETNRARRVLIIDGEMNLHDLRDRLAMLIDSGAVAGVDREKVRENLSIIARQDQDPEGEFYDITDPMDQKGILQRCNWEHTEVLIVDNLTTVADGLEDENDAAAFRTVQGFLLRMKQAEIATILVHHARKDGQSPRGSTALMATFEVMLGLRKPDAAPPGQAAFTACFEKFRAKGDVTTTVPHQWVLGDNGWRVEEDQEDTLQATLNALQTLKFATQQELAEGFGMSKGTISKRLKKLAASGRVTEEGIKSYLSKAKDMRDAELSGGLGNFDAEPDESDGEGF